MSLWRANSLKSQKLIPQVAPFCLAAMLVLSASLLTTRADNAVLHIRDRTPLMDVEEVTDSPGRDSSGWQSIYSAYSCVYHHSYALASRWLMFALKQGAGNTILKARTDTNFLAQGLSSLAEKRHEALVPSSSCDVQVLQALMEGILTPAGYDALDILKRVAVNNPTYPNLQFLKIKIRDMEFERSGSPWLNPPDVAQSGGKGDGFSKWRMDKFPLKVYVPTDAEAKKTAGYKAGDGQLLRTAFETWQRESAGKILFRHC